MSIMVPDVNFGTAGSWLFGSSQNGARPDSTVGGSVAAYCILNLMQSLSSGYGTGHLPVPRCLRHKQSWM